MKRSIFVAIALGQRLVHLLNSTLMLMPRIRVLNQVMFL